MKKIWKYDLKFADGVQEILMPEEAKILTVALQNNTPVIWAEVKPERSVNIRRFFVYATGQSINEASYNREYIGTFQIAGVFGPLVGHVFELL